MKNEKKYENVNIKNVWQEFWKEEEEESKVWGKVKINSKF